MGNSRVVVCSRVVASGVVGSGVHGSGVGVLERELVGVALESCTTASVVLWPIV